MSDALLEYAYRRIVELESLLLVDVAETVWPAEVVLDQTLKTKGDCTYQFYEILPAL
ncbi:hypothetical protein [Phytobacter sp. AG2a]